MLANIQLTVISPCYNESESIRECVERTQNAIQKFSLNLDFEHIFIDNASTDSTLNNLIRLREEFPHIRILQNQENIGVFQSIQKALKHARGAWVIPFLASDNQDPPEVITDFLKLQQDSNCDSVFGVRKTRIESRALLAARKIFYQLLRVGLGSEYKSGTSEFCLIRRNIADVISQLEDKNPFLRIYLSKLQGEVRFVDYQMDARKFGKSSANLFTLTDDALNAFSIVMPSIFSRLLVIAIPVFIFTFFSFLTSVVLYTMNFGSIFLAISAVCFGVMLMTFISSLISILGHYVFILHAEIRTSKETQTTEF